jgi:hypothetical protein
MTCGIYSLNFKGTEKVYIGQSVCIEKRYPQHLLTLRTGTANTKLLAAYRDYGTPTYTIVLECCELELDDNEEAAIAVWDSVNNGFNIYSHPYEAPCNTGYYGVGNTQYLKSDILKVFHLLVHTNDNYTKISEFTNVNTSTVGQIAKLRSHTWLKVELPEEYKVLEAKAASRNINGFAVVSDKLSAKSRGIIYPKIKDPEGTVYTIDNAYKFAKERGLAPNHFQEVLNGHRKSHKGWKLACLEEVQ